MIVVKAQLPLTISPRPDVALLPNPSRLQDQYRRPGAPADDLGDEADALDLQAPPSWPRVFPGL